MGGGTWDRSTYSSTYSTSGSGFSYSRQAEREVNRSGLDRALLPFERRLSCAAQTGIGVILDVTGSMGTSALTVKDKLPMFDGQIEMQGYLTDWAISFAAVGDITSDNAPLQVCDFEKGGKLDRWIDRLFLEGNGGGQKMESYEMMAYYYLHCVDFTHPQAAKPFLFFVGDEAPYPDISPAAVRTHFGGAAREPLTLQPLFDALMRKYHVHMLHVAYNGGGHDDVDNHICQVWRNVLGENFRLLNEPQSVVDVMLGIIALISGTRSLESYVADMQGRGQTDARIAHVSETLQGVNAPVPQGGILPAGSIGKQRAGGARRV